MNFINVFILDCSGSMFSIKENIIKGYNEQVKAIKDFDLQKATNSYFVFTTFNSTVSLEDGINHIKEVEELNSKSYVTHGGTALYDAIGLTLKKLDSDLRSEISNYEVLITVLTDGEENSSVYFSGPQIADLIKYYQEEHKWTISFIGANIDVEKLCKDINIDTSNTLTFTASAAGTADATETLISSRTAYYTKKLNREDTSTSFFQ